MSDTDTPAPSGARGEPTDQQTKIAAGIFMVLAIAAGGFVGAIAAAIAVGAERAWSHRPGADGATKAARRERAARRSADARADHAAWLADDARERAAHRATHRDWLADDPATRGEPPSRGSKGYRFGRWAARQWHRVANAARRANDVDRDVWEAIKEGWRAANQARKDGASPAEVARTRPERCARCGAVYTPVADVVTNLCPECRTAEAQRGPDPAHLCTQCGVLPRTFGSPLCLDCARGVGCVRCQSRPREAGEAYCSTCLADLRDKCRTDGCANRPPVGEPYCVDCAEKLRQEQPGREDQPEGAGPAPETDQPTDGPIDQKENDDMTTKTESAAQYALRKLEVMKAELSQTCTGIDAAATNSNKALSRFTELGDYSVEKELPADVKSAVDEARSAVDALTKAVNAANDALYHAQEATTQAVVGMKPVLNAQDALNGVGAGGKSVGDA